MLPSGAGAIERERLTRSGRGDDHVDRVTVRGQTGHQRGLFVGELRSVPEGGAYGVLVRNRRVVATIGDSAVDDPLLERQQIRGRVTGQRGSLDPTSAPTSAQARTLSRSERHDLLRGDRLIRELFDPPHGRAYGEVFTPGAQHIASIERTRMGGQPGRAHELFDPLVDSSLIHQPDVRSANDRAHRVGFDTKGERLGAPSFGHRRSGDPIVLRLAGIQGGDLRGPGRRCTALGERGFDLDPPRRKRSQHWFGDAVDVSDAVHDWTPRHPEALGHLGPQVRLIQVAGGLGVEV